MAKEFKNFDKMFSRAEIHDCRNRWLYSGSSAQERNGYVSWNHVTFHWSNDFIRYCVYLADDQLEWQLFRVSLKGLTTSEKLYMLDNRMQFFDANDLKEVVIDRDSKIDSARAYRERCRIDNYIGALIRGGQLSTDLKVQR